MSCSIQLNAEQAIVYYQHNGAIGKTNIIEAWEKVLALLIYQGIDYNLILDYREAHFIFKPFEIDEIVHFFYSSISALQDKKIAGIANAPHEAAIIKLIETFNCPEINYQVKLFYAFEEALKYLK
jgi:hypothetical protein